MRLFDIYIEFSGNKLWILMKIMDVFRCRVSTGEYKMGQLAFSGHVCSTECHSSNRMITTYFSYPNKAVSISAFYYLWETTCLSHTCTGFVRNGSKNRRLVRVYFVECE